MSIALDYTSEIGVPALRAADVTQVCRYISRDTASWKVITAAEYRRLIQGGIIVTLNWEFDNLDWMDGTVGGRQDGLLAVQKARALGYPKGSVIIGSCDFDCTATHWKIAMAYAVQFKLVVEAGGYRAGVYGPWDVLTWSQALGYQYFWQAGMSTAWSSGRNKRRHPLAQLRQIHKSVVGGKEVDVNEIIVPNWGLPNGDPDLLTPEEHNWLRDINYTLTVGTPEHVRDAAMAAQLQKIQDIVTELKNDPSVPVDSANADVVAAAVARAFSVKLGAS